MKKLLALGVCALATWAAVNAQTTKQFSGEYKNGKATYSYYVDPESQEYVKHGSFSYSASTEELPNVIHTIKGSFSHGKRNGTWVYTLNFNNTRIQRGYSTLTITGSKKCVINYKDGYYNGSFTLDHHWAMTAGRQTEKEDITLKLNFKNGKLVGSAYLKDDDLVLKGQYTDDSYCTGTWTGSEPSADEYTTIVYKNEFLTAIQLRDADGDLQRGSFNSTETYNDFLPYLNSSDSIIEMNDFEVSEFCNKNSSVTTEIIIKYIEDKYYVADNLLDKWNSSKFLEGDLNLSTMSFGGCTKTIQDHRNDPDFYTTYDGKELREAQLTNDIFKIYDALQDVDVEKIKPSQRRSISAYKDSIEEAMPRALELARAHYLETNETQKHNQTSSEAIFKNVYDDKPYDYDSKIFPPTAILKDGKTPFYISSNGFDLPNSRTMARDYYGDAVVHYDKVTINASTPGYYYLFNALQLARDFENNLASNTVKFSYKDESGNRESVSYYSFYQNKDLQNRASEISELLMLSDSLVQLEKSIFKSLESLNAGISKSSKLKSWASVFANYQVKNAVEIMGCTTCEKSWLGVEELPKALNEYKASLMNLEQITEHMKKLNALEDQLKNISAEVTTKEGSEKNAFLKSGYSLFSQLLTEAINTATLSTSPGSTMSESQKNISVVMEKWQTAISMQEPIQQSIAKYSNTRQNLDSVKASTFALAEAAGVKEYVSCYSLFDKTLAAKFKELDSTPSSATTPSAYQAEIATATTNLTSEMEPFVLLQSVLSKPLTKENKKAIKGASKDPVALMAVLKTL